MISHACAEGLAVLDHFLLLHVFECSLHRSVLSSCSLGEKVVESEGLQDGVDGVAKETSLRRRRIHRRRKARPSQNQRRRRRVYGGKWLYSSVAGDLVVVIWPIQSPHEQRFF